MSVRKQKKAATRQRLEEAAIQIFHEKGLHGCRVSDIVGRAGVAQGTFYNHFESKEAVFNHIADSYLDHYRRLFLEYSEILFAGDDLPAIIETMRAFLRQLLLSCRENIAVAQLVFGEGAGTAGPFYEKSQIVIGHFVSLIEAVLVRARDRGLIFMEDPEMSAAMIFGLFQRCMFYFLLTKEEFDVDKFERGLADFLLNGLNIRK
ncbi:MAG: TetR/AcrR family transcriptional regulator [Desulfosudaceae bacterium]